MKTIALIISTTLNIILIVLFLFRTALNDIVKKWWMDRQKVKEEFKNRLVKLRVDLTELSKLSFLILVELGCISARIHPNIQAKFDSTLESLGKIHKNISDNEIYYPKDIRDLLSEFMGQLQKFTGEALNKQVSKERLLQMSNEINIRKEVIIKKIDSYLL